MSTASLDLMAVQVEMTEFHIVHAKALIWRMRCLAHRLVAFGWEEAVKSLSTVETLVLAAMLPPYMGLVLIESAYATADARWRAFIEREVPQLTAEVAAP